MSWILVWILNFVCKIFGYNLCLTVSPWNSTLRGQYNGSVCGGFSTSFSSWYSSRLDLNFPTYVRDIWNFRTHNFGTIFKLNCFILSHTSSAMSSLGPNIVDLQIHWCQALTLFWFFLAYVKICRYIDPWCDECPLL